MFRTLPARGPDNPSVAAHWTLGLLCAALAIAMVGFEQPARMAATAIVAISALSHVCIALYCAAGVQTVSQRHSTAWMLIAAGATLRLLANVSDVLYPHSGAGVAVATYADIPRFLSAIPFIMAVLRLGENRQVASARLRNLVESVIVAMAVVSVYLALDAENIARLTGSQTLYVAAVVGRPGAGMFVVWTALLALCRERTTGFATLARWMVLFAVGVLVTWLARTAGLFEVEAAAFLITSAIIALAARATHEAVGRGSNKIRPRYWNGLTTPLWQQLAPQAGMYVSMLTVALAGLVMFWGVGNNDDLHAPAFAERGVTVCVAVVMALAGMLHAAESIQSRRVRADLTRLLMTTSQLADAGTPRDAIPQAVQELRQLVPSKSTAVYLTRKDGGFIRLNFAEGSKSPAETLLHTLPAPYADALTGTSVVFGTHGVGDAELIVPLRTLNLPLGLLVLTGKSGYAFSPEQASLAQALTSQLALSIDSFRLRRVAADTAITDERNRLARELHDSVSQALFSIALGSRTARELVERKVNPADTLDYVVSLAEVALGEMRALVFELRPESMMQFGLLVALRGQLESLCERNHMAARIDVRCAEPEQSPPALKESVYRIVMEAANNAVKHARASELALTIDSVGGQLLIELRDNGRGFDASGEFPGHLGLISMRERAQRQGGQLIITSQVGQGTVVRLQMPLVDTSSEFLR